MPRPGKCYSQFMAENDAFTKEELDTFRSQTNQPAVTEKPVPVKVFSSAQQWGFFGFGVVVWLIVLVTSVVWARKKTKVWRLMPVIFMILLPFVLLMIYGNRLIPN
jgi:hypothetical protein